MPPRPLRGRGGTNALIDADVERAERVVDLAADLAGMREELEITAVSLPTLQAPVAGELRQVVTAIQLAADSARMGALAEHIAVTARRHPEHAVPEEVRSLLARMGAVAVSIATGAVEALDTRDPHRAADLDGRFRFFAPFMASPPAGALPPFIARPPPVGAAFARWSARTVLRLLSPTQARLSGRGRRVSA